MFQKILIANRGEIACRVITTARRMGVQTVAVYSDADAQSLHVALADAAVRIGPAPARESYLRGDVIIAAALATGAQAIHPGYGFLSENPDFVDAVTAAGLVFIGPSASAIRAMGLKDAAKSLMEKAGVPVVPGYHGAEQDADHLAREADKIGYPVLIKARAGGGGKGMRLVEAAADFRAALEGAQREGQSSFGDPAVLIERYVTCPRHIEIQVFGDNFGNAVHLFERDCSLQRRHQKVIEEAPAPGMTEAVRAAMGRAAVEAAKAIGYSGAGTVEFIVDGAGGLRADGFWFMEMNTRLQVEHPVSEAITGLDFVELQLRVAAGEALPFAQGDLHINGHAFEARLYAEDVPKGFLPATGSLDHLRFPVGAPFARGDVRIDSGVRQGDMISPWYDPMIAKIIVHAPTRAAALAKLGQALAGCQVMGCVTNLDFLSALSRHSGFAAGEVDTGLIARHLEHLTAPAVPPPAVLALAAIVAAGVADPCGGADPWSALSGWRPWSQAHHYARLHHEGAIIDAEILSRGKNAFAVSFGAGGLGLGIGGVTELSVMPRLGGGYAMQIGDHRSGVDVLRHSDHLTVFSEGRSYRFTLPDPLEDASAGEAGGNSIAAPMPGLVKAVNAVAGQVVVKGDAVLVLEAMKMEHTLTAPRDGVVAEVFVAVGDQVVDGVQLLVLEPSDG